MIEIQSTTSPLRVLSFGAGAIGAYIGGSLALAGHQVVFLEKPAVADEIQSGGIRLELMSKPYRIEKPSMETSLDKALEGPPFDLALFALKAYDTRSVLNLMKPISSKMPPVLCLQNGVTNEDMLASVLGADKVIPGTVTSSIARRSSGDIILERLRGVGVARGHSLSRKLVQVFSQAGLSGRLYESASSMKWSKLLTNITANACSAILDMEPQEIYAHPGLFRFEIQQSQEALAVMRALNIPVVNLPGTPVRAFAFAIRRLPAILAQPILKKAIGGGRGGKMPSFHIDLYGGRGKSEVLYLNGAVADFGEQLNCPTPANRFLTDTLMALTKGELSLKMYARQPDTFLAAYSRQAG